MEFTTFINLSGELLNFTPATQQFFAYSIFTNLKSGEALVILVEIVKFSKPILTFGFIISYVGLSIPVGCKFIMFLS